MAHPENVPASRRDCFGEVVNRFESIMLLAQEIRGATFARVGQLIGPREADGKCDEAKPEPCGFIEHMESLADGLEYSLGAIGDEINRL